MTGVQETSLRKWNVDRRPAFPTGGRPAHKLFGNLVALAASVAGEVHHEVARGWAGWGAGNRGE